MSNYSYIGVAEDLMTNTKFLVRSNNYPIHEENIVVIEINGIRFQAEVLHAALFSIGCDEESVLAEFGEIHDVEKIYGLAWEKKEEVTEDGN